MASVARRFKVCTKTVYAYCAKAGRGELRPRPLPGRIALFGPDEVASVKAMVQENPDLTLDQMCAWWHERTGARGVRSTLHDALRDALRRAGMRFKKKRA